MVIPGLRGLPLRSFFRRLGRAVADDNALDGAAGLAYYFLFSLFPLLFFAFTLTAYLPLQGALEDGLDRLRPLVPASSMGLIERQLHGLLSKPRPRLLTASLFVAVYSASRGMDAFRRSLNLAYQVSEARSFLRQQWLALWTTAICAVLVLAGLTMIVLGGDAGIWLARRFGIDTEFALVWSWLRWPTTALLIMLVAALTYYWLPDVDQRFKFITPGSVTSTLLWLLSTWGFTQYANHAANFNVTYGSLGGAVVLLLWLYLTALVFILGGEINAVIERASPEGKRAGAKEFGEFPDRSARVPLPPGVSRRQPSAIRLRLRRLVRRPPEPPPSSHP